MRKEATGKHGQVLGSFSYFSRINRATFWGNLPHADGVDYYRVLREAAGRAEGAISGVYDDLQRHKDALIAIPESDRKKLAKQVQAFYDGNGMGGGFWQKRCASTNGGRDGLSNALLFGRTPYVRVDPPHNGQGYQYKYDGKFLGQNEIYDWIYKKLEHYPSTEDTYHFLKNLDDALGKWVVDITYAGD